MITENIHFYNSKNQKIAGRIYRGETTSDNGVIYSHGLFSSKDGYKITRMASDIVESGFTLLTFDFSFAGESEGELSDISVIQEVDDLVNAVQFFKEYGIGTIHLIGSSMGGTVSLLYTSENQENLSTLTLIATPIDLVKLVQKIIKPQDIDSLPDDGFTDVQGVMIKNKFFKEQNHIDMRSAISRINVPTLIIHGQLDEAVDVDNAILLHASLNSKKKLVIVDDGEHTLTRDSDLKIIRENIIEWVISNS
jgi:pimeloyl-ACP methyl ester carboxylesterase